VQQVSRQPSTDFEANKQTKWVMRPVQVNRYLNEALDHFAADLQSGALISIGDNGIRVRRLPLAD
jgi:hypothetical protein